MTAWDARWVGLAHDMCNEFAELFQPVRKVVCERNKDGKQVSEKRNRRMKGKKRKRSVDVKGDQDEQTEGQPGEADVSEERDGSPQAEGA